MAEFISEPESIQDGVYILSGLNNEFESVYLDVREKEKRIYSDEELLRLPFASDSNPHKIEWHLRTKSYRRFKNYIKSREQKLNILDLGCGNGWFSGQLSGSFKHNYYCVDLNLRELKQGRLNFKSDNLKFIYADIFSSEFPAAFFDIVVLNAAVQYFPDFKQLIASLLILANNKCEIHIIDSPIYSEDEVPKAKQRTIEYYSALGFPKMSDNYFHHSWKDLSECDYRILYNPGSVSVKIKKLLFVNDSPFPWIRISR